MALHNETIVFSVAVITLNEERNIGRCLESVRGLADDIVVVDSGSADRTAEIARGLGARVLDRDWTGSFSEQKQFAVDSCSGAWVLVLDADEWLSEELASEIRDVVHSSQSNELISQAYELCRSSFFLGKRVRCWKSDWVLRLFRRQEAEFDGKAVHERIVVRDGGSVGRLRGDLHHEPYTSIEAYMVKLNRYTSIDAQTRLSSKPRWVCLIKLIVSPVNMAFRCLILRGGVLDGVRGFMVSLLSGVYEFVKYSKALERWYRV